ncbi:MAG: hypothetical protein V2B19_28680 [Pseudomonadota bacterium]
MPEHALFYPEWGINDPNFLSQSLLYWDRLGCIVPQGVKPKPWQTDPEIQKIMEEAHEQFVSPILPTAEQKSQVFARIAAFAELEPPDWCRPENIMGDAASDVRDIIAQDKLSYEAIDLLQSKGWIAKLPRKGTNSHPENEYHILHSAVANLLLGALAEICSSPTMPPITDKPGSFSASCNMLLTELGSRHGISFEKEITRTPGKEEEIDAAFLLTRIPNLGLDDGDRFDPNTLKRLLRARNDPEIDGRRKAFQKKVDEYLNRLRAAEAPEQGLIADEFDRELKQELGLLERELRRAGVEPLVTKEGVVASLASAIAGVALGAGVGLIIGLSSGLLGYRKKRRETLDNNWSSWIFSASTGRITLW